MWGAFAETMLTSGPSRMRKERICPIIAVVIEKDYLVKGFETSSVGIQFFGLAW